MSVLANCTNENTDWLSFDGRFIECKVVKVYDGDTITVVAPLGNGMYKVKCRLQGIDTPEIRTKDLLEKKAGYKSKTWMTEKVLNKCVWLQCGKYDKYGRVLATVFLNKDDEQSLNDTMVFDGAAQPYDGGQRQKFIPKPTNVEKPS
jgi:endonuclease YncB( thermonuclease family)